MRITDMKPADVGGSIRAFFKLETEEGILIDGFKVVNGKNGLFVSAPSRKFGDRFVDTVTMPKELKNALSKSALEAFEKMGSAGDAGPAGESGASREDVPF